MVARNTVAGLWALEDCGASEATFEEYTSERKVWQSGDAVIRRSQSQDSLDLSWEFHWRFLEVPIHLVNEGNLPFQPLDLPYT